MHGPFLKPSKGQTFFRHVHYLAVLAVVYLLRVGKRHQSLLGLHLEAGTSFHVLDREPSTDVGNAAR